MAYLLDANVFIEAKRRHYGFDFCPAFWDWLDARHADQLKKHDALRDAPIGTGAIHPGAAAVTGQIDVGAAA